MGWSEGEEGVRDQAAPSGVKVCREGREVGWETSVTLGTESIGDCSMQLWWHGGRGRNQGLSEVTSWGHRCQLPFEGHEWVTASRLAVWFPVGET